MIGLPRHARFALLLIGGLTGLLLASAPAGAATAPLRLRGAETVTTKVTVAAPATSQVRARVRGCDQARLRLRVARSVTDVRLRSRRYRTFTGLALTDSGRLRLTATARCKRARIDVASVSARSRARVSLRPPLEEWSPPTATTLPVATPMPTASPVPTAATPVPTPAATPSPAPAPAAARRWGLIGNRTAGSADVRQAGVTVKVVRLSWKDLEPKEGQVSTAYVNAKKAEIAALRAAGLDVIVDSGLHDTPQWIHSRPNSYLISQFGERWTATTDGDQAIDKSDANLIFNPALRAIAATYLKRIGETFGSTIYAIRIGGGRWNELGYPPPTTKTNTNSYWAYDALAQQQSPVPGWKPGHPSPNGQAQKFYSWYLQALVDFQQWQIDTVRTTFKGPLMVLYPGWGIRPGQAAAAVADRLRNRTPPELNAEIQRGFDWTSQVAAIKDPLVFPATTWVDARFGSDTSDATQWRPPHFLRSIAGPHATLWSENTGQGTRADLEFAAAQTIKYGFAGMVWFREEEFGLNGYATLSDYRAVIAASSS